MLPWSNRLIPIPMVILSLCQTSTVGGRGRVCWSMRRSTQCLSSWNRVGRSAQVLIVTRSVLEVSCSCHCLMRVSSRRPHATTGKLPWNMKPFTLYHCRSHFREARSLDYDVTVWDAPTQTRARMECTSESFFWGRCKFKILGDRDMIADAKWQMWMGCGPKIPESVIRTYYPSCANSSMKRDVLTASQRRAWWWWRTGDGHCCVIWNRVKFTMLSPTALAFLASFNYCVVTSLPWLDVGVTTQAVNL